MENLCEKEILNDFSPRIKVYKDGTVERLIKGNVVSPSYDPKTGVRSKDVTLSNGLSARIDARDNLSEKTKMPLLIYIHGGAFCMYSASSSIYHNYLNSLVSEGNVIAVSVDYRLAPWLNQWTDFDRVYFGGDSAGANIAHEMVIRVGSTRLIGPEAQLAGLALIHPFFGEDKENPLWEFLCPSTTGKLDPRLDPASDLGRVRREVGCGKVLVCVGEKDFLRERGVKYYELLREGVGEGWKGEVEFIED